MSLAETHAARQSIRETGVQMAQLLLSDIDTETVEQLELRAKRLGTTPEEEASRLLRERLVTPAIVHATTANALDPEIATKLKTLQTELAALKAANIDVQQGNAEASRNVTESDPRFVRRHGFLVFTGAVATEDIPDHRVLRDERIDTLLQGIDEGRV